MEVLTRGGGGGWYHKCRALIESNHDPVQTQKPALFKTLHGEIVYLVERRNKPG